MARRRWWLLFAAVFGCSDAPSLTGFELSVRYDPSLGLDQIALSGRLEDGREAFAPGRVPEPARALIDGSNTIVVVVPEALGGRAIDLLAEGMARGVVAARGEVEISIVAKSIVTVAVSLEGPTSCFAPPCEDAGVADADAGPLDLGPMDVDVHPDAEDLDTGQLEGGEPDALADTGAPDTGSPDTGALDAGLDTGLPDVPVNDAGCTPVALSIGDGIDQDCDGFDECYGDSDGDDIGGTTIVADNDLACRNGSALTSPVDTDCDDGDALVFPGTACNDGSSSTRNDFCFGPSCRGYETSGCPSNCAGCGLGSCCARGCPSGSCPTCPAGCSCDFTCDGDSSCTGTCEATSVCHIFSNSVTDTTLTCEAGASCDLECNSTSSCHLECQAGAFCIISDCNSSSCTMGCAAGPMSCPGGVLTCNRDCP